MRVCLSITDGRILLNGCAEDIAHTVHAHLTLAGAMHEAALGMEGRMLNL
jgi:hypothetical protein